MVFSSGRFYSISLLTPIRINFTFENWANGVKVLEKLWCCVGEGRREGGGGETGGRRGKLTLRALAHRQMECSSLYSTKTAINDRRWWGPQILRVSLLQVKLSSSK